MNEKEQFIELKRKIEVDLEAGKNIDLNMLAQLILLDLSLSEKDKDWRKATIKGADSWWCW